MHRHWTADRIMAVRLRMVSSAARHRFSGRDSKIFGWRAGQIPCVSRSVTRRPSCHTRRTDALLASLRLQTPTPSSPSFSSRSLFLYLACVSTPAKVWQTVRDRHTNTARQLLRHLSWRYSRDQYDCLFREASTTAERVSSDTAALAIHAAAASPIRWQRL